MNRRQFLCGASGTAATLLAGCQAGSLLSSRDDRTATVPHVECGDSVIRTSDQDRATDGGWPTLQGGPRRRGYRPGATTAGECPSIAWTVDYEEQQSDGSHFRTTVPVIADDRLIVGDKTTYYSDDSGDTPDNNTVVAADVDTGRERWRADGSGPAAATPTVADGMAFVPGRHGLQAFDLDAQALAWDVPLSVDPTGEVQGYANCPAAVDGTVYAATTAGAIHALDATTGEEHWTFTARGIPHESQPRTVADSRARGKFEGAAAFANGTVYAASWDGRVYAVDAATGRERWTFDFGGYVDEPRTSPTPPTVVDDTVYTSSTPGVYALDATSGEVLWHFDDVIGTVDPVTVTDATVYADSGGTSRRGYLLALDRETGQEQWRRAVAGPFSPTADDRAVYFGGEALTALDHETGEERWRFTSPSGWLSAPSIADGRLYVVAADGTCHALE